MGGGKTHSMLALRYLAANPKLFDLVAKDITQGVKAEPAKVVAISGRSISRDKHLWGDITAQLGKADRFLKFYKGAPVAPNEKDWVDLIGDTPTLILLDELTPTNAGANARVHFATNADVSTKSLSSGSHY
jgi:predicted AAA+ superfamily ATPase